MIKFDFELDYFDEVENDIEVAKLWYYEQSPDTDLEERFANAIKETISKLQKILLSIIHFLKTYVLHILNFFHTVSIL